MLNYIWLGLILLAVITGGLTGKLTEVTGSAFDSANYAVMNVALPLTGIMAIWLGMMRLAEQSGFVQVLARALKPLMRRLFPDVPPDHPAMASMVMTMAANMLGLSNAATPLGLRAMSDLEKLNPRPGTATNAMCTFLAISTSSIQLIPTTVIGILAVNKSLHPTAVVGPALMATTCAAVSAVIVVKLLEKLPMFQLPPVTPLETEKATAEKESREVLEVEKVSPADLTMGKRLLLCVYFGFFILVFAANVFPETTNACLAWLHDSAVAASHAFPRLLGWFPAWAHEILVRLGVSQMKMAVDDKSMAIRFLTALSLVAVPLMLSFFPLYALLRGIKVYEQFVSGAKEAFPVALRIIPFLVAMLVAMGMFRASGCLGIIQGVFAPVLAAVHFPADVLPVALMRPLSGGATIGLFTDLVHRFGPDHFNSLLAGTIVGSTETTFYVLTVYFGSVSVNKMRHAVLAGLTADLVGVVASVIICNLVFR
ncbi:MAG TPA: nucleoside recognition domain-containing protein [Chthoniobacteraceae bacterium]|nr:nucleoside recognition domain-containing protein [Chthoniobacteraceae bacterium]